VDSPRLGGHNACLGQFLFTLLFQCPSAKVCWVCLFLNLFLFLFICVLVLFQLLYFCFVFFFFCLSFFFKIQKYFLFEVLCTGSLCS
jgi:hypothetical protein